MRKLITFILCLLSYPLLFAQTIGDAYYSPSKPALLPKDKISSSIATGVGFSNYNNNIAFTTFIAPKIGYRFNNKFKLNVGLFHYNTTYGNKSIGLKDLSSNPNNRLSGNFLLMEGEYRLNKNSTFLGAIMYDVNNIDFKQNNYKGIAMGWRYQPSPKYKIEFTTIISKGSYKTNNPQAVQMPYYNSNPMFDTFGGFGNTFTNGFNNGIR